MKNFEDSLKSLNPMQKKAVEAIEGPVMVIAGPGTGKTHILTLRIANILQKTDVRPSNILALTFTDNAAKNMQRRLQSLIGNDAYKVKIETFHSFCNDVIQQYPEKFGLSSFAGQITELEKLRLIEKLIESNEFTYLKPFNTPMLYRDSIISTISDLKREGINPDEFMQLIKEAQENFEENKEVNSKTGKLMRKWSDQEKLLHKNLELRKIYKEYQNILSQEEKYDYDDMILFVIDRFERDDDLLARFQEQYLYVLVDEFQDTNGAQSKILELIGSFDSQPNIFVVGDDAQSIYRFQGANVENMYDFIKKYPGTQIITLEESYRCPEQVLQGAESLIKNNKSSLENTIPQVKRTLHSHNKSLAKIDFIELDNEESEALFISEQIKSLIDKKVKPESIAVIFRTYKDSLLLKRVLAKNNIPTNIIDPQNILEDEYIIKLLKLFESLNNPLDDKILFQILNYDFLNIERLDIFKLAHQAGMDNTGLLDSILESKNERLIAFINQLIEWGKLNENTHFTNLFEAIINKSGLLDFLKKGHRSDSLYSISKLFNFAQRMSEGNWDYKLANFLQDIHSLQENRLNIAISYSGTQKGINLLTAHKAKGLEFDHIFIINTREGNWSNKKIRNKLKLPSNITDTKISTNDNQTEEERRLLYVAITRAKKNVTLTYSIKSIENGREREFNESQFVNEISDKLLIKTKNSIPETLQTSILDQPKPFDFSEQEKEFLISLVENFRLSYSSLNQYLEDPAKFLYQNLLRIPSPVDKTLVLGSILHKALEVFNNDKKSREKRPLEYYEKILYTSLKFQPITFKEAEEILKEAKVLLKSYIEQISNIDGQNDIAEVEYNFAGHGITLNDIALTGKVDVIGKVGRKDNDKLKIPVRITDYKTSTPKSRNFILGNTRGSDGKNLRQLQFYKLLTDLDERFPYKVEEFEIAFIKPNPNGTFKSEIFTREEIDTTELKEIIINVMTAIRELKFDTPLEIKPK